MKSRKILMLVITAFLYAHHAQANESTITNVEGQAQILRNGQSLEAKNGMDVRENDILQTAAGASVDFSMNKVAGIRLSESSEQEISSIKSNAMQVKLKSGKSVINLSKLPSESSFKVETPTAIAAARGTQFLGNVVGTAGNLKSSFAVRDGIIDVMTFATRETFSLTTGQALDIPADFAPRSLGVRKALGAELTALDQASSVKTC